jgi:DHA2 family methylenomycin A resistance protein-like MFS transporter
MKRSAAAPAYRARMANTASLRPIAGALVAASVGFALIQLDVTIVNVALPRIGVALFGAFAGAGDIVAGLHLAVLVAAVAMLSAAGLAAWGIRESRRAAFRLEKA